MSRPAAPVPQPLLVLARRQAGLVTMRQCLEAGMTSRQVTRRVERKEWERVARGVFDTDVVQPETRSDAFDHQRRRTALLGPLAHAGGIAVGCGALVLHGVQGVPVGFPAEVAVPKARPRVGDGPARVRRILVPRPVTVDGIPCMPVTEALALAVPALGHLDAVAVMDSARYRGLVSDTAFARARSATTGRRGARRSYGWWDESDARSESPAESWGRVLCILHGVPPDAVQLWVLSRGLWSRVDLAWVLPDGGLLIVEIDGRDVHEQPRALVDDRHRQNRLDTRATLIRRYSGSDARAGVVAREVSELLRAVGWRHRPVQPGLAYDIERAEFFPKPEL